MESQNRAVVAELIELMNTRDQRPTHLFHPEIEWHWAATTPGPTIFRGHEELATGDRRSGRKTRAPPERGPRIDRSECSV